MRISLPAIPARRNISLAMFVAGALVFFIGVITAMARLNTGETTPSQDAAFGPILLCLVGALVALCGVYLQVETRRGRFVTAALFVLLLIGFLCWIWSHTA